MNLRFMGLHENDIPVNQKLFYFYSKTSYKTPHECLSRWEHVSKLSIFVDSSSYDRNFSYKRIHHARARFRSEFITRMYVKFFLKQTDIKLDKFKDLAGLRV